MSDQRSGDRALASLVSTAQWITFCKAVEAGNVSQAQAHAMGLQWRLMRVNRGEELVYTIKVSDAHAD